MENLYNILGVAPNATPDEIKKSYRALAMRYHPDRNTHPGAESRFNSVKNAYEVLSDDKKRSEYNQTITNRIVIDPDEEARALWLSLFGRCGIML
ncbi:MAG: molecular chaperone DnaJ [Gallionellales bacterium RIFOXYB12_FULL_54_9]|nr:MAG: molecular chaperone DnaJ [Gallionellales bacterium RIFOXYB12_FULL_54_9]